MLDGFSILSRVDHPKKFLVLALFSQSNPSWLKVVKVLFPFPIPIPSPSCLRIYILMPHRGGFLLIQIKILPLPPPPTVKGFLVTLKPAILSVIASSATEFGGWWVERV